MKDLIEEIHRPLKKMQESTIAGRAQVILDNLFGVDKIGLDPGEKPSKSQPSEADIAFIDSLIFAPGTTKVTKITPEIRARMLKKRLEKGDLTPDQTKKLGEIVEFQGKNIDQEIARINVIDIPQESMRSARDDLMDAFKKQGGVGRASLKELRSERNSLINQMKLARADEPSLDKLKKITNFEGQIKLLNDEIKDRLSRTRPRGLRDEDLSDAEIKARDAGKKPTDLDVIKGKRDTTALRMRFKLTNTNLKAIAKKDLPPSVMRRIKKAAEEAHKWTDDQLINKINSNKDAFRKATDPDTKEGLRAIGLLQERELIHRQGRGISGPTKGDHIFPFDKDFLERASKATRERIKFEIDSHIRSQRIDPSEMTESQLLKEIDNVNNRIKRENNPETKRLFIKTLNRLKRELEKGK